MEQRPDMPLIGPGSGVSPPPAPQVAYVIKPRPKWQALRTIASILKVLAWMTAGLGVIGVLFVLVSGNRFGNPGSIGSLLLAVATAIGAGSAFLGLYGYAELILVIPTPLGVCRYASTRAGAMGLPPQVSGRHHLHSVHVPVLLKERSFFNAYRFLICPQVDLPWHAWIAHAACRLWRR